MKDRPHLVSGLAAERSREALHGEFVGALREAHPDLMRGVDGREAGRKRRRLENERDKEFKFSFF